MHLPQMLLGQIEEQGYNQGGAYNGGNRPFNGYSQPQPYQY